MESKCRLSTENQPEWSCWETEVRPERSGGMPKDWVDPKRGTRRRHRRRAVPLGIRNRTTTKHRYSVQVRVLKLAFQAAGASRSERSESGVPVEDGGEETGTFQAAEVKAMLASAALAWCLVSFFS